MSLVKARGVTRKARGFAMNGVGCRLGGRRVPLVRVQGFGGEVNVLPKRAWSASGKGAWFCQ